MVAVFAIVLKSWVLLIHLVHVSNGEGMLGSGEEKEDQLQ